MRDDDRFNERFGELLHVAFRVALRILHDREEAEDVATETLARALVRWRRIAPYADRWVVRVATNLSLDIVRRGPAPSARDGAPPRDLADDMVDRLRVSEALRRLSRRQREVTVLRFAADLTDQEIAERLQISTGAVKQHGHRAIRALQAQFGPAPTNEEVR